MKIFTKIDAAFCGNSFNKLRASLVLVFVLAFAASGNAQLFEQQFATTLASFSNSNSTNATYINATPSNAQLTYLGSSGTGATISVASNKLTLSRTGNGWGFARGSAFSGPPSSMMINFDYSSTGASAATTSAVLFAVGGGTTNGSATTSITNSDTHTRLGFNCTATSGQFVVRDIAGSTNGATTFSGTQNVLLVINNSGATLTYKAPDGTYETVANDRFDVWVGTSRQLDERSATTAAQTLSFFKCVSTSGNQTVNFGNMLMNPIPAVPTSGTATGIGSADFTANWTAISGVTGYRVDVATDAAFTSLVSGYNNLYVSGQATNSLNVTGLSSNTTYYYRVRGASQYTVGEFAGGNSASQNLTTSTSYTITYANLQFPTANQTVNEGTSITYYGRVYAAGITDSAGEGTLVDAWIGYSSSNSDPSTGGWTWVPATYNVDDGTNNDEYQGTLSALTPGTYYVAYRYQASTGPYVYGGKNNAIWASTSDNAQLTVNSLLVDFCNVQYPPSGTITQGDTFNVYAKVYLAGVTNVGSPGAGISGWIGYSTSNTNPNTWTNWVAATFNTDAGNDDEYVANIGTSLPAGTYYYASRFQRTGSTEYRYGDINGVWDNTTDNGVLVVNPQVPVITPASPTGTYNTAFSYNIIATQTPTAYAISSGTLPTGLSLNTTTGEISGTPTQIGTFNVNFTATNSGGTSTPATISITINQASQTITFGALSAVTYGDATFALTATASSGLTVSYASSDTNVATVAGNMVTIVGQGTTTITASQAGDANYTAATNVDQVLTVNTKSLTVTGVTANNKLQDGTTTATLSGTASLSGVVSGDESNVSLTGTPTATFASATPGTGIAVTVTGYTLSGSASANYSISQPTGLTADITALDAPVATAATGILYDGFTANWNAVTGATSYVLDVYEKTTINTTDLFISEYVEGSSNNKYLEIYNGTGSIVDLSNYDLVVYTNGSTSVGGTLALSGNLADGATYVIRNNSATVWGGTSDLATGNTVMTFNGNDVIALRYLGTNIDVVGTIGSATNFALDTTLTRLSSVSSPTTTYNVSDWASSASNTVSNLGAHSFAGGTTYTYAVQNLNVGSVTSYDVTGLDPETTYYYVVRAVNGSFTTGNSNEINLTTGPAPVTWNGTAWSNGTGPTASIDAIIEGDFSTDVDGVFSAKSLTLNSGSFTIVDGDNITVVNEVNNTMTAADFVVENNANLLQEGTSNNNTGSITVKRNSATLKRLDYTLWSSPVAGQGLYAFSPFTFANRFYVYNPSTDLYAGAGLNVTGTNPDGVNGTDSNNVPFAVGTSYLIRMPWNHPTAPTSWTGTFTGVPNNGTVTLSSLTNGSYYAIGNPYPSTIDANTFIGDNNIGDNQLTPGDGLYFWRKTNNSASPSYATYTTAGGTASGGDTLNIIPNGTIQVGQGFIVRATSTSIEFNNLQRTSNNDNQFLRTTTIERNRIWLNLSDATTSINQMMVAYMTGATQGIDAAIDGRYFNDNPTALNSFLNNEEFAIQGRSLPFDASDVVPLAFKAATAGNYSIAIDHVDGLFADGAQDIYLKDNLAGTVHDLNSGAYSFASTEGSFNNRFEIVYQSQLGIENPGFTVNNVIIYSQNNNFVINSGETIMKEVKVFDIRGRLLQEKSGINSNQTTISGGLSNQVLLVQITSDNGVTVTKKVIR